MNKQLSLTHFFFKKKFFNLNLIKKTFNMNNFIILYDGFWDSYIYYNIVNKKIFLFKNKKYNIISTNIYNFYLKKIDLLYSEYDLKGVNYWFSLFKNLLFLDLGYSNFKIFNFNFKSFFFKLKKKWFKWLLLLSFSKKINFYISSFIRFKLKNIGPYKLKGFQFVNEWIILKEGKKPFK